MVHDDPRHPARTGTDEGASLGDPSAGVLATAADRSAPTAPAWVVWLIGPLFIAVGAWFVTASPLPDIPMGTPVSVSPDSLAPVPFARPGADLPEVAIGGYDHRCNECHRFFDSPPIERRRLTQHTEIVLEHGLNNRCFNCHDRGNRELLVLYAGPTVTFDQVPRLCAQCHGTVYRDWQRGTHGKTLGSWDAESGRQRRLGCNDCHDPHAPAYPPLEPLPAPNTLRMGDQHLEHGHGGRHEPLRRWSSGGGGHAPARPVAVEPDGLPAAPLAKEVHP